MSLTIRDRLAYLIAALQCPAVLEIIDSNQFHPDAHAKYVREMRLVRGMPEKGSASDCFKQLLKMAKEFNNKLKDADCFPKSVKPDVTSRHAAEAAMSYLHRTYVGGATQVERNLLTTRRIGGLAELLDGVDKARKLVALTRYFAGDYLTSTIASEQIAHRAIDALMPFLTDYYADLVVIDRDTIVDALNRDQRVWIWAKDDGNGTWLERHISKVPDSARMVIEVSSRGVKKLRRAPQLELAA